MNLCRPALKFFVVALIAAAGAGCATTEPTLQERTATHQVNRTELRAVLKEYRRDVDQQTIYVDGKRVDVVTPRRDEP